MSCTAQIFRDNNNVVKPDHLRDAERRVRLTPENQNFIHIVQMITAERESGRERRMHLLVRPFA